MQGPINLVSLEEFFGSVCAWHTLIASLTEIVKVLHRMRKVLVFHLSGFYVFSAWKDFIVKILLGSSSSKTVIPLVLNCSTSFLVLAGRVAYLWGVSHCNHQL